MNRMIIATGNCAVDYILKVPQLPGHDEKVIATDVMIAGGSPPANFACAVARLGNPAGFVGIVGEDSNGLIARKDLVKMGVDARLQVIADLDTPFTVIIVDATGEKSLVITPNPIEKLSPEQFFPKESLNGARHLHTHLFCLAHVCYILRQAKEQGLTTSIDLEPSSVIRLGVEAVRSLLRMADMVFVNTPALLTLAEDDDPQKAVWKITEYGSQIVLATGGAGGSLLYDKTQMHTPVHIPAYKVEVVDTSGAGDCFAAAFVSEYLATGNGIEACRFASAAAALSITRFGIRNSYPTRDEVECFLKQKMADER